MRKFSCFLILSSSLMVLVASEESYTGPFIFFGLDGLNNFKGPALKGLEINFIGFKKFL